MKLKRGSYVLINNDDGGSIRFDGFLLIEDSVHCERCPDWSVSGDIIDVSLLDEHNSFMHPTSKPVMKAARGRRSNRFLWRDK